MDDANYLALLAVYQPASMRVWNDHAVWRDESASGESRLLAWPRPEDAGTQFRRRLAILFNAEVDVILVWLKDQADPLCPAWPPHVRDPKMQVLLRVVQRALEAGEAAVIAEFGGVRITGAGPSGQFCKRIVEEDVRVARALARSAGITLDEAFALYGLPRRRAFRASKRTVQRAHREAVAGRK